MTTSKKVKVTPEDIIRAAEENGYVWLRGGWFNKTGNNEADPITEACILGQVALNLGVDFGGMHAYLRSLEVKTTVGGRQVRNVGYITSINDNPFFGIKTYQGMVKVLKRLLKPHMDNPGVLLHKYHYISKKTTSK